MYSDLIYMNRALQLARRGTLTTHPNPRVGCVIVRDNTIIGEGWHVRAGQAHAEINALQAATQSVKGATVYVTLEPCSHQGRTGPCSQALIEAGVGRVVIAMTDPNPQVAGQGIAQLKAAGIQVSLGVYQDQAAALNPGYIKRMQSGHPYVRVKLAASADARTAMASGESQWITGEAARLDGHRLRARSDAIVSGVGTILADDPQLNVRLDGDAQQTHRQPVRVILDAHLRTPATARVFDKTNIETENDPGVWICCDPHVDAARRQAVSHQAQLIEVASRAGELDLRAVLDELGRRAINEVLVEAGANLAGAFVQSGLADELIVYQAACLMGDQARPLLCLRQITRMSQRLSLRLCDCRHVGADLRFTYSCIQGGEV